MLCFTDFDPPPTFRFSDRTSVGGSVYSLWDSQTHRTLVLQMPTPLVNITTTTSPIRPQRTHQLRRRRQRRQARQARQARRRRRPWILLSPNPGPTLVLGASPTLRRAPERRRRRRRTGHSSRKRRHSTFQVSTRTLAS